MSIGLISWGRFFDAHGNKVTVPAPPDNTGKPWLWDFLAGQCKELADVGFDTLQLPPASKAFGGAAGPVDGYGVFDSRDLGDKPQQWSTPTRYGSAESLRRLAANAHACGLNVYLDLVLHQLMGANEGNGVYRFLGSDAKTLNGRGAMHPGCFRGVPPANRPDDDVPAPADDFSFGNEKVYQRCDPPRYTIDDALDFGDWIFRTIDADGARFDDVKGTWAPFVAEFMNSRAMAGKPFAGEYFDGNPASLNWWATTSPMNSRSGVEDFTNHFAIQSACDGGNAEALNAAGYNMWRPDLSYVFVDNPDTDSSSGQQVTSAKLLGYAYLATIPSRMFLIYGKDYYNSSVWPGAYGLRPWIDNLIYISKKYAYGKIITQFVDKKVIVLNRDGDGGPIGNSAGLLTALNFDTYNNRAITCATTFGANAHLHDLTGHHSDIWTDGNGRASFTIPSNSWNAGQSYLCFTRAFSETPLTVNRRSTTQTFFGSPDLSIPPASESGSFVSRIWCESGTEINLNKLSGNDVRFMVTDSSGHKTVPHGAWHGKTNERGWHTIKAFAGVAKEIPYVLQVTYMGTQGLTPSEIKPHAG